METLNNMKENECEYDDENIFYKIIEKNESIKTHEKIIEYIHRKNMFQKLLNETLQELNQTNPSLESGKYHLLCIYTSRYNNYIDKLNYKIINYELKNIEILSIEKQKHYKYLYWCWKTMKFYFKQEIKEYSFEHEKNIYDKKRE
jgi:hypothetical protein